VGAAVGRHLLMQRSAGLRCRLLQEKKYTFDVAFGAECTNSRLYKATIAPLIKRVVNGHNCTVFAYGATGSGKTYTMVGSSADSGLMVRSMESLFAQSAQLRKDEDVSITASYLEVYNEVRRAIFELGFLNSKLFALIRHHAVFFACAM
jgi:hypothetical protein